MALSGLASKWLSWICDAESIARFVVLILSLTFASQWADAATDAKTQSVPATAGETSLRSGQSGSPSPTLQLSNDELYALQKLRIQKELEDEILKWFQTRFWIIAVVSLLLGIFGVRALVREFVAAELKDAMRASAEAQAAAASARESIKEVRVEAGKYKDLVDVASATAANVSEKLQELRTRIDSEGARSVAAADLKIAAVNEQLDELRKTVSALATDSARNREIVKAADLRIERTRETAQASEAEFSANADINVLLVPFTDQFSQKLASDISTALTIRGFKVSRSPWDKKHKRVSGNVRLAYQPMFKAKVGNVSSVVEKVFLDKELQNKINLDEKDRPISNDPDEHIVVFFE